MPQHLPFYFAVPHNATTESRAKVPSHLRETFGVEGKIEHVRNDATFRLYRVVKG